MRKTLITVIMTYYKKKKYLKKTVESLNNQSLKNFQLIFVYDETNKQDLHCVKKILSKIKNKKLIINKNNIGVAKSRNKAIKYIKGRFTAFLDCDDIWSKNKLKTQLNFMIKNKFKISCTSYLIINNRGKVIGKRSLSSFISYKKLIKRCEIGLSTVILNSKILKLHKFPILKTQEDFALWLKLLRNGYKFGLINLYLTSWRKDDHSLSSNSLQKIKDAFRLFYRFENKNLISSIFSVVILSINKLLNYNQ